MISRQKIAEEDSNKSINLTEVYVCHKSHSVGKQKFTLTSKIFYEINQYEINHESKFLNFSHCHFHYIFFSIFIQILQKHQMNPSQNHVHPRQKILQSLHWQENEKLEQYQKPTGIQNQINCNKDSQQIIEINVLKFCTDTIIKWQNASKFTNCLKS